MFEQLKRINASRWPLLPLFVAWLAVVLWLAAGHVFFRDEVRALSIATAGATVVDMLRGLHGEGHPAVWYLLLRGGHALIGNLALPVLALAVAVAAAALLLWRAPFSWPVKALILFSKFMLFEYVVMARNYGIAMLLMFAFAALYPRWRSRGIGLGLILALLANTSVHATLIAAALMLVWLLDSLRESRWRWTPPVRLVAGNALLLLAGAALCLATVWPSYNDAGSSGVSHDPRLWLQAILVPGPNFYDLAVVGSLQRFEGLPLACGLTLLLGLAALGLIVRPVLMLAAIASMLALSVFFEVVYGGGYRHEALWLVLLVTLFWIAGDDRTTPNADVAARRVLARLGGGTMLLLLGLQVGLGFISVRKSLNRPQGAARALEQLIDATPSLRHATIVADPDFMIEALPYYLGNPLYQLRQPRSEPIVRFTVHARLALSLDDVFDAAQRLHREHGTPVVILLRHPVDPAAAAATIKEGYNWTFSSDPAGAARFTAATTRLATFDDVSGDEAYAVYRLRD